MTTGADRGDDPSGNPSGNPTGDRPASRPGQPDDGGEPAELPTVWASLLERPYTCGERLRRSLRGQFGSKASTQRFAVANQIREDARLAHPDLRAPTVGDFPDVGNLLPEQLAVYRAAARGYVTLFPEPVVALDPPLDALVLDDAGVQLRLPRDLVVEGADGTVELRRFTTSGRTPTITVGFVAVATLAAAEWGIEGFRVRAADLLALEPPIEHVVVVDADAVASARDWVARAACALFAASEGPARPHDECGRCDHIWTCPAHEAARRSGAVASPGPARNRLLPDLLRITPSSLETFSWCARRYLLKHVLGLPESDPGRSSDQGLLVHDLLRHIHERGSCHDRAWVDEVVTGHADDDAVRLMIDRHQLRCPTAFDAQRHEMERARYHHRPVPMFLATARVDAVWVHDGIFDVRDYKTGVRSVGDLRDDVRAQVQAWVFAPRATAMGLRLQLRYEYLSPEAGDDPPPWAPDDDDCDDITERLRERIVAIRRSEFDGIGEPEACRPCPYRSICPDSAAPGVPTWPALAVEVAPGDRSDLAGEDPDAVNG